MKRSGTTKKRQKNKVLFLITTYNRPETLIYLLSKLYGLGDILVYNDGSDLEYYGIDQFEGLIYIKSRVNNGRTGYYKSINYILNYIKTFKKYDYYVFCPDDFDPISNFLDKSIEIWNKIKDKKKICLNLYSDKGRFMKSSWTGFSPVIFNGYLLTQWVDMCFLCEYKFFEALDWKIDFPTLRTQSSGVGKNISLRLSEKYHLYQTKFSMFVCLPDGRFSKMFLHERHMPDKNDMVKREIKKKIKIVGIATIPGREKQLLNTIESLYYQCDQIVIALNGFNRKNPEYLDTKKYLMTHFDNKYGDSVKFFRTGVDCYYFSCDDDIIYPPYYIQRMTELIEFYGNNCIITMHGRKMKPRPVKSYYRGHEKSYNLFYDVEKDIRIDVGGTGVMAFDTEYFKIDYRKCIWPNMADIWVSKFAKQQNMPIILAAHKGVDFKYQQCPDTIYSKHSRKDKIQTQLYNSI